MKLAKRIGLEYYRSKFNALAMVSPRKAAEVAFRLFCTPYTTKRNLVAPSIFKQADQLTMVFDEVTVNGFRWHPKANFNSFKILICHGFDSYSYRFEEYIPVFLQQGFEVLAFDAPAHGISKGTTITVIQYQNMILAINEQYGPIHGVMAHSFGGLAVALALEQLQDHVCKKLVLVAPATETTHAVNTFFSYLKLGEKVKTAFNQLIEEQGGNPASWYSVARVMQQVNIDTLWVHDREDSITPYQHLHHLTEANLAHIQFEITTGLGHSLYTDSEIQAHIVQFFTALIMPSH